MTQYTCNLTSNGTQTGHSEWSPSKPAKFNAGDQITFTSSEGNWSVQFDDSPFRPTAMPQSFTGQVNTSDGGALLAGREGLFPFRCSLTVGGKSSTWPDGGDDIRTGGK